MRAMLVAVTLSSLSAGACSAKEQGPCEGVTVQESDACATYASDFCRALSTKGDCQADEALDAGGAFCQWTRVATLVDEDSCTFAEPFGRCEAAACSGFCDGPIADACGPDDSFLVNGAQVFVAEREMIDVVGSGSGRIGTIISSPTRGESARCEQDPSPTGPSWCSCGPQACASVAGIP